MANRLKIILSASLTAAVAGIVVIRLQHEQSATAPIVIFPPGYQIQAQSKDPGNAFHTTINRAMPSGRGWGWLWKVRYAIVGQPKIGKMEATVFDFQESVPPILDPPNLASTDGLQVWRLNISKVDDLRQLTMERRVKILTDSRGYVGNNFTARLSSETSVMINDARRSVGLNIHALPSIRREAIDLIAVCSFSEAVTNSSDPLDISVHTNLEIAARVQLTKEVPGIFVLMPPPAAPNQRRLGLLLKTVPLQ